MKVPTCHFREALLVRLAHCRGRFRQWGWTAIVLPAAAGMVSTGCMAIEMAYVHSTSFVAPLVLSPNPSPAAGPLVAVRVEDRRAGVAGYEVGAKYNPSWGYEGSTIDFKDKASLADQVAQDAVGARFELASSIYPSDAEFQGCFERLYITLRDKMRDRLRVGLRL